MATRFLCKRFLASQTAGRPTPQPSQYRNNLDNLSHLSPGRSTNTKRPATPPPPRVQTKPTEPRPAVDKQATSNQADGKPPTLPPQKGLYESVANLNEYQKLYFALGWFAFALAGVYATYKLEEKFPLPKRPVVVGGGGGGSGANSQVEAKSQFDLLLAEETEAQLQAEAGTS
ncbi:hypothetical protein HDU81_010445 [Chytriomyces hyalinus]|nr:hypothetical protein HDU81_010445 [Chytriomyces hyalinus]